VGLSASAELLVAAKFNLPEEKQHILVNSVDKRQKGKGMVLDVVPLNGV